MSLDRSMMRSSIRKSAQDVGSILVDQVQLLAGPEYHVALSRERHWASITFSGTRHSLAVQATRPTRTDMSAALENRLATHEFELSGHFVADLLVQRGEANGGSFTLEILTIIDPVAARSSDSA